MHKLRASAWYVGKEGGSLWIIRLFVRKNPDNNQLAKKKRNTMISLFLSLSLSLSPSLSLSLSLSPSLSLSLPLSLSLSLSLFHLSSVRSFSFFVYRLFQIGKKIKQENRKIEPSVREGMHDSVTLVTAVSLEAHFAVTVKCWSSVFGL